MRGASSDSDALTRAAGGCLQYDGSEMSALWPGIVTVPSTPTASSKPSTTACGPPSTQPIAASLECTIRTAPADTPSERRSVAMDDLVTGHPVAPMTSTSGIPRRVRDAVSHP
jgi:hypothetical protein